MQSNKLTLFYLALMSLIALGAMLSLVEAGRIDNEKVCQQETSFEDCKVCCAPTRWRKAKLIDWTVKKKCVCYMATSVTTDAWTYGL